MIQALIFDLDNTLLDRQTAQRTWTERFVMSKLGVDISTQLLTTIDELLEVDRLGYADREEFANHVLQRFPQSTSADQFLDKYRRELISMYPRDEAVCSMIERLKKSYRLGVVSNGRVTSQLPKMCQVGLCPEDSVVETASVAETVSDFEAIVISGDVGIEKPLPEPFNVVLQRMDLQPEQTLYIGDNPWHDIGGAVAVGMQTCWVALGRTFPEDTPRPDLIIDSILDLEDALQPGWAPS